MSRYCASCGTEVDDTAIFCPTCGQPIDQAVEAALPPAPAWPDPSDAERSAPPEDFTRPMDPAPASAARDEPRASGWDEPAPPDAAPPHDTARDAAPRPAPPPAERSPTSEAPPPAAAPAPRAEPSGARPSPLANLPITAPVMLSGWLIGVGTALAAIGALVSLFDVVGAVVDLLLLIALAGVSLSVFLSSALPAFGQLRLVTLAIVLVAFGAATDRVLGGGGTGVGELLLFLGAAAATIGVLLVELGRDQPMGGSQR